MGKLKFITSFILTNVIVSIIYAQNTYDEDVSSFRPTFKYHSEKIKISNPTKTRYEEDTNLYKSSLEVDDKIAFVIDSLREVNSNIQHIKAYRVLAYSGLDRNIAMRIRKAIQEILPEENIELIYTQPNFKLFVGGSFDRLSCIRIKEKIKSIEFAKEEIEEYEELGMLNPLIIPDKIKIRP